MTLTRYFRINKPEVICETFDDEVVLVNLDNGNYYSVDKVGADIWSLIERGATVSDISKVITYRYRGNYVDIESAVQQFMAELQQENLIIPTETNEVENIQRLKVQPEIKPEKERTNFEQPILQRYTDMQDLLLLDPIHEVDETGWPAARPNAHDGDD